MLANTRPTRLGSSLYASHVISFAFRIGLFAAVRIHLNNCLIVDSLSIAFCERSSPGERPYFMAFHRPLTSKFVRHKVPSHEERRKHQPQNERKTMNNSKTDQG